jgi:hypothetical protein
MDQGPSIQFVLFVGPFLSVLDFQIQFLFSHIIANMETPGERPIIIIIGVRQSNLQINDDSRMIFTMAEYRPHADFVQGLYAAFHMHRLKGIREDEHERGIASGTRFLGTARRQSLN